MNNIAIDQTSKTSTGALAFAIGTAMMAGHPTWPTQSEPSYTIEKTTASYSQFRKQLIADAEQPFSLEFPHQVASIFSSLNKRQERLGEDFERAIFGDLESLYEA